MTRNQEKQIKQMVDKWLEAKGGSIEEREHRSAAWMKYFSELKVPKPVYLLAAATWLCSGAVILPEDMPKVEQAVRVAEVNKVDPLRYDRPMAIIDEFPSTELKEAPIDPDTVPTLHLANRFASGLTIYSVEESQESRENMRKIINTHFGKDSSPWCLLQGDGKGNLTPESAEYWRHYSAYPKQVAFIDGKLVAFSANSNSKKIWWDRMDKPNENIAILRRKIKGDRLGRVADMEFNPKTGDMTYNDIHRYGSDGWGKECYASLKDVVPKEIQDIADPDAVYVRIPGGVTEIGERAFCGCKSLQEVHIPNSVTEIYQYAFCGCKSLQEVHIPDGVTEIGYAAFSGCTSLREIHIPDSVAEIDWQAFSHCSSLRKIHIPDGVTKIGMRAFEGCTSLQEVHIPDGVTWIGGYAFSGCTSLREIHIPDSVAEINKGAFQSCSFLQEIHIPDSVTKIDGGTFTSCTSLRKIHIPNGVKEIGDYAFSYCSSLQKIHIPDGVTKIGNGAFSRCSSLQEVHIPNGVTEIDEYTFKDCTSLQEIHIPEGVTNIGEHALSGCNSLREVHIPDGVTEIGYDAFEECSSLQEVHIPDSVTRIDDGAFADCTLLRRIYIPNGVSSIENNAFAGCTSLKEISLPEGIDTISELFTGCSSLQEIHIPDSVTRIASGAFWGCSSLQKIHIPDSVTEIYQYAFSGCKSLQEIHIPDGVTEIGYDTFNGCTSLQKVYLSSTAPLSLVKRLESCVSKQCVIIRAQPKIHETELAVLKEYGVSDKAIKTLQEKSYVNIKENTFYRRNTPVSPCPENLRNVKTDILVVNENGHLWVKAPDGTGNLGSVSSFFEKFKKRSGFIPKKPTAEVQEVKTLKIKQP